MHARNFLLLVACCAAIFVAACSKPEPPSNFETSIAAVQRYCDAFVGRNIDEIRASFAGAELSEDSWSGDGFGGVELVATYPNFEVRVLFLEEEAITAAITVMSE